MATEYMDYGSLNNQTPPLVPVQQARTQVYLLTHDEEGKSLPFMDKAFISFTYGGKKIEDFGLIAVTVNDRLNRQTAPASEDYTTDYKMLHGQYYWGSHYNAREMEITLATDGMTQQQIDSFKYWFSPGEIRQLIMAEHPNRAIMARVQGTPQISMLPFQKQITKTIVDEGGQNKSYNITIIEYKGNIELTFVMDQPFWYAKRNALGKYVKQNGTYVLADRWVDANGVEHDQLDEDAYKIIVEDKIPTSSMVTNLNSNSNINFGDRVTLKEYNQSKYVLDDSNYGEAIDGEAGAPIVNDDVDLSYPISGAVVGRLYRPIYEQDSEINIEDYRINTNCILGDDGNIINISEPTSAQSVLKTISIIDYLDIKSGSTIQYNKSYGQAKIINYIKDQQGKYIISTQSNAIEIINSENDIYIAENNTHIRLTLTVQESDLIAYNDTEKFTLSEFLNFNLIAISDEAQGVQLNKNKKLNYFYSGNAPSYPEINFSIPIIFDDDGYIITFKDDNILHTNYNTINLQGAFDHSLKIINPTIFSAYNKVIAKLHEQTEFDLPMLIQWFRNQIGHEGVRSWIINCINIYHNNFNMSQTNDKLIVDTVMKEQLLKYMPYFFASFEQSGIQLKEDEPETIKESSQNLNAPTIERIDNGAKRLPLDENTKQVLVAINDTFRLAAYVYKDNTKQTKVDSSTLNYWWQISGADGKWHTITNTTEYPNKWTGVNEQILICNQVTNEEFNSNIRCIVSNNLYYRGENTTVTIKEFDPTISITAKSNSILINQNSTGELIWNVNKEFMYGVETINQTTTNYNPELWYQPDENSDYILCYSEDTINDNYNGQITSVNLAIDKDRKQIKFTIGIKENNEQPKIRGTKFRIIVYQKNAFDLDNNNTKKISSIITVQVKRLEIGENPLELTGEYDGNIAETINDFSRTYYFPDNDAKKTYLNLSVLTDKLINLNYDESCFVYKSNNSQDYLLISNKAILSNVNLSQDKNFSYINNSNNEQIELHWTFNPSWNNINGKLYFKACAYGETYYLPTNGISLAKLNQGQQNPFIRPEITTYFSGDDIHYPGTKEIYEYQTNNKTIDLKVEVTTTFAESNVIDNITLQYNWYKGNMIVVNDESRLQWDEDNVLQTRQKNIKDENSLTDSYSINLNNINNKGYYKCKVGITINYNNNWEAYTNQIFESTENSYYIDIIIPTTISNARGESTTCEYYSQDDTIYLNQNDQFDYQIDANDKKIYKHTFQYTIVRDDSSIIKWYYSIGETGSEILIPNENGVSYTLKGTASAIYNNNNPRKFWCVVIDKYGKEVRADTILQLKFSKRSNRRIISILDQINLQSFSQSWNWYIGQFTPVLPPADSAEKQKWNGAYNDSNIIEKLITCEGTWIIDEKTEKGQLVFDGTPRTLSPENDGYYDDAIRNKNSSISALKDKYKLQFYNRTTKNYQEVQEISIIKIPQTILQLYNPITIKFNTTSIEDNFTCILYIKNRLTEIEEEEEISNNTIEEEEEISNNTIYNYTFNVRNENNSLKYNSIEFLLKLYYNTTWPDNIGYLGIKEDDRNTIQVLDVKKYPNPEDWDNRAFNKTQLPSCSISFNDIEIQGIPNDYTPNVANASNNLFAPRMLSSSLTRGNILSHDTASLQIKQTCPVSINCATGEYYMDVHYNTIDYPNGVLEAETSGSSKLDPKLICYLSSLRFGQSKQKREAVGDMVIYNNFLFNQQNHFDYKDNIIKQWSKDDKTLCHRLTYDGDIPLQNFSIKYKNYYL